MPLAALAITTAPVSVVPIVEQSVSIYDAGSFQVVFNNVLTGTVATFQSTPFFGRIAGLVAAKSAVPSIGHTTPWAEMTAAQRNAFKHSYSRHGKELGLPNWSEANAGKLQEQFNNVVGYVRQNGTQLPGPIMKPWNGKSVEVNFFEAEFHGCQGHT